MSREAGSRRDTTGLRGGRAVQDLPSARRGGRCRTVASSTGCSASVSTLATKLPRARVAGARACQGHVCVCVLAAREQGRHAGCAVAVPPRGRRISNALEVLVTSNCKRGRDELLSRRRHRRRGKLLVLHHRAPRGETRGAGTTGSRRYAPTGSCSSVGRLAAAASRACTSRSPINSRSHVFCGRQTGGAACVCACRRRRGLL